MKRDRKPNMWVVAYSVIALGFLALSVFVHWLFILGTGVFIYLNQRELMRK
jgi:hypothetical protein